MSATSKGKISLETPVQYLKGVGPRMSAILNSRGINTVRDLLLYLPRDYQDRSRVISVSELNGIAPGDGGVLLKGHIINFRYIPIRKLKRPLLEATFQDKTGRIALKWFHYQKGFLESRFKSIPEVFVYGTPQEFGGRREFIHPEVEFLEDDSAEPETPGLLPIYVEPEGLTQRFLRKIIQQSLDAAAQELRDDLPRSVLESHKLMRFSDAIQGVHNPRAKDSAAHLEKLRNYRTDEHRRLIFDDFFKFEWVVGHRRLKVRREDTTAFNADVGRSLLTQLQKRLPFEMTDDQKAATEKIFEDLANVKPMNRLLQGDVGCGKTLVALASALPVVGAGAQAAIMAPTEILAEQHLKNAKAFIDGLELPGGRNLRSGLLVGSTTKSQRQEILTALAAGQIDILIGTHALLEDPVVFKKLGLVVIDEQHRFGVDQRMTLRSKGKNPHLLSLTATPIPRTLALTAYGDLDVSTIKQLPKGRPEVITKIVKPEQKEKMFQAIRDQLEQGRQAYIIYPLVQESEKIDLANAVHGAEELANGAFQGYKVGLLHGKLKGPEKTEIMDRFKAGEIDVLVSTTVIEVGVDVPNATVLVVEHAERFGLSQLHQLRGRVGRGTAESHCYLLPTGGRTNDVAYERLSAMEETRDGFKLAELDLKIRGPGEFLGTRQSGDLNFPCADLVRDQEILVEARKAAFEVLRNDPDLKNPENAPLKAYMESQGALQQARFETA